MASSVERTRADFDRIAALLAHHPDEPDFYDAFLLERIPTTGHVLEIGCGTGRLARAIAARGADVTAIDLSPEMIRVARERSGAHRISYLCTDLMEHPFGEATFDAVVSVATLHHLPFVPAIERMKSLMRPGGILIIHDVRKPSGVFDWLRSGLAAVPNGDVFRWLRRRRHVDHALHQAWHDHGARDVYLAIGPFRALCREHLAGAEVTWHPLWRSTAVWKSGVV